MKRNFTTLAAGLIISVFLLFHSCSKIASNLQYDLSMQTASVDISLPPLSDTSANVLFGSAISFYNFDSFIKANTGNMLGVANIGSAKMVSCTLTLINPNAANNFANFQNSNVMFFTNSNTTPFDVTAITNNPDTYAETLNVPVDATTDISSYLHGNQLTYSLSGKLRRATTDTIICRVQLKMNVHVHG